MQNDDVRTGLLERLVDGMDTDESFEENTAEEKGASKTLERKDEIEIQQQTVLDCVAPFVENIFWLKFMAYANVISGGLLCLTLVGAIVGFLPVWTGLSLRKAILDLEKSDETGQKRYLVGANEKLVKYFVLSVISMLFSILI